MLHLAADVAVAVSGGPSHQRLRARANVRLLLILRTGDTSDVEEVSYGVSDRAVLLELLRVGANGVLPRVRVGLLRSMGMDL